MVQVNTPITINQGGGGAGGALDKRTMMAPQKHIEVTARTAVKGVLANEKRPGGDVYS